MLFVVTATVETVRLRDVPVPGRVTSLASRLDSGDGLIARPKLVQRLVAARAVPVVLLVAPAGYGKTVLLSEWERRDGRRFAWCTPGEVDNDRAELGHTLADAGMSEDEALPAGSVLVIDGFQALHARDAMALISDVIDRAEPGSQVVLASRTEPPLRLGRLRAERRLVELRPHDLAMTAVEAAALLGAHGLALDRGELELLVRRTEGWPAALYLATLAARAERHPDRALADFAGDDRFVADYIDDEVLAALDGQQVEFLERASVLGSLSGPLCDFVLERDDSARLLKRLSRSNLMLVPLDRSDGEYRYHRLFAQTLRAELRRAEPSMVPLLHRRASDWYSERGDVERSIEHAVAGGDVAHAGDLIWGQAASLLGFGQLTQVRRWLSEFSDLQLESSATLSLAAAACSLVMGDRHGVEHWTATVGAAPEATLMRVLLAEDRVGDMAELARSASAELPGDSAWFGLACWAEGVGRHLIGEREPARQLLEEGARRSAATCPNIQALCLAQLGLLAVERHDSAAAESLAALAKAQVERSGTSEYPTSALVYAQAADVEAQLGRIETSQGTARQATALLAQVVEVSPWYEAECRIALARAALRLSDIRSAGELLSEAARSLVRAPDAKVALRWIADCRAQAEQSSSSSAGRDWSLTTAELRVLQFLPTHLSFPDIAERLYVSANTVKTHARSVYRKLDASSRGEAVVRARDAGLLDQASHAGVGQARLTAPS
jgi:LuxR family transcriptional regulator, maltose regulon positive regulatory protein